MHVACDVAAVVGGTRCVAEDVGAPVHQAHGQIRLRHHAVHLRVGEAGGDVVDHVHPGGRGDARRRGAHRVHGGANPLRMQVLDDGAHALGFYLGRHPDRAGARRLRPDIDDVRAAGDERAGVIQRTVEVEPAPAVGKGVGRDVHNAHHQRPSGHGQLVHTGHATTS